MSHRPCSAHPRRPLPCWPCCPRWDYHRFAVQMVTQGSPSPRWLSVCPSQLCCAGNTMSWDSGGCWDSFSTGLLLEENICINLFLSFLALGLWKKQNSTHHPAPAGMGAGCCGTTADPGTHSRGWYLPPGTSLWHTTTLCSPVGTAPLSRTLVKNARVVAL